MASKTSDISDGMHDLEAQTKTNSIPESEFTWKNLSFKIKDKEILSEISCSVSSGRMLAIMGPSGAGKSTLLDLLAQRVRPNTGNIYFNGYSDIDMSELSSYVEQDDALLGVLTVEETIRFAARLSFDSYVPKAEIDAHVHATIAGLGLAEVSKNRIGTPIQRGISGGQKRRVTIGTSLVTLPKILLLDEPTSGLDSSTSREVMASIKNVAKQHNIVVIATVHQPNWDTFSLFDNLLLLAQGRTVYCGPVDELHNYLATDLSHPVPIYANPADHALDLVNVAFASGSNTSFGPVHDRIDSLATAWTTHEKQMQLDICTPLSNETQGISTRPVWAVIARSFRQTLILMERNMINYARNLLAYGIRLAMYIGMGVMLATIWVNLAQTSPKINDRLSVHFFSVAFLGFMSVAGIPAFLEERRVFVRERMNGLYGPGAYVLANSICSIPYLFVCATAFCVLCYWSIGLHPGASAFFRFLIILFLAVYAAESQSIVVAAILPIFVAALAIASFLNGFWMSVGGYFIKAVNLPRFWYYWAHFIDYQTFSFNSLVASDFRGLVFDCVTTSAGDCQCDYPSSLLQTGVCQVSGEDVLRALGINGISLGLYAGIVVIIIFVFRFLFYLTLVLKKR